MSQIESHFLDCEEPHLVGNGQCDDSNMSVDCIYDGGDCDYRWITELTTTTKSNGTHKKFPLLNKLIKNVP